MIKINYYETSYFLFLALAMLNHEAIDGIHGGVYFCDGQAHPYSVCLTNKAGDEVCHQFTDSAFTMDCHENWGENHDLFGRLSNYG